MSLPFSDRVSPRDAARAAAERGRFHDVVIAASKVLHDQPADDRDTAAFRWATELLTEAESKDVLLAMPSAHQLTGPGNVVLALRRAARKDGDDPSEAVRQLRSGVEEILKGRRSEDSLQAMESLRTLFSLVSRLSLQTEIVSQNEPGSGNRWGLLTTTSDL